MDRFIRNEALLGKELNDTLINKTVLIIGLGGVGGYAAEGIARLGVKKIILVDFDRVEESNINRQIIALTDNVSKLKVDLFEERIKRINPEAIVIKRPIFVDKDNINIFDGVDFVIEAIDTISAKFLIIKECLNRRIPFVSSMGMARRIDSTQVRIDKLSKTSGDGVAKKLRELGRKEKIDLDKIKVVYSLELPQEIEGEALPSIMSVPASAGLACVSAYIKEFQK